MTEVSTVDRMSDADALAWAIEHDPRLRSPMSAVVVLNGPVDHGQLRHTFERASRIVPRMRHRVVPDPAGLAPPTWEVDPDFALAFHVRLTNLYDGPGRDLLSLAASVVSQPFDRAHPPWEVTVVDGLRGGRSAVILKSHHAMTDGIGAMNMMAEVFDLQRELTPGREVMPAAPEPDAAATGSRLRSALDHEAKDLVDGARRSLGALVTAAADPIGTLDALADTLGSASRVLRPDPEPLSPIMTARSPEVEVSDHTLALEELKAAGRRVGGSVNDAFVAGILLGVGEYHRVRGSEVERIRMAIPINTRGPDDDTVGNNWTPSRAELPLDVTDPDELMRRVHGTVARIRTEPAQGIFPMLASALRRFPPSVVASLFASMSTGVDVAASNLPGSPVPVYLAGREVAKIVPLGPLSGAASNITLLSLAGAAHIGVVRDRAAVPDGDAFLDHLRHGFERVGSGR